MAHQEGGLKVAHLAGPGFRNKNFDGKYVLKDIFEDENQNLRSGRGGSSGGRAEHGGQRFKTWSF